MLVYEVSCGFHRTEYYEVKEYDNKSKTYEYVEKSRTVTDWRIMSGKLPRKDILFENNPIQIYGGFHYPRSVIENVLTFVNIQLLLDPSAEDRASSEVDQKSSILMQSHEMVKKKAEKMALVKCLALEKLRLEDHLIKSYDAKIKI